ncbi:hypothetical protein DI09_87p10 [Mitosporidium daphniae]|uniref:Uncharacterized protein n=1 Tax=Mitosporidium daphniae TaxID=1485682 RepID=A0A098VM30_9MICR|nr:uncharacterized protein DI09_87p10 [Mitosporidium daphniae]KGG50128.1 hypothetical protein DI09_87p10 [Mitosporidium daphniae]|eukprot:XP_013236564.1 uncharacterized protein DI09_87p10 [Mitosporidium daphniae]
MQDTTFDHFTLSSDYSLDTSKYKFGNIDGFMKQSSSVDDAEFMKKSGAADDTGFMHEVSGSNFHDPHPQARNAFKSNHYRIKNRNIMYGQDFLMLDLKNENSRLRETNTAWMNFRNQALKLGRGFPSDGNSLLQQNIPNENPNSNDSTKPDKPKETQSQDVEFLQKKIFELTESENKIKGQLLAAHEISARLRIKVEQTMTRCELSQVSYTRMKECYDDLLAQHQQLSKKIDLTNETEMSTQTLISTLKNELEISQSQLSEAIKSLNDSKEEIEFWVAECQKFKRDYLYYRMAADNNAKKIEQVLILLRDKEADFKALEEEHVVLLKKIGSK